MSLIVSTSSVLYFSLFWFKIFLHCSTFNIYNFLPLLIFCGLEFEGKLSINSPPPPFKNILDFFKTEISWSVFYHIKNVLTF